MFASFVIFSAGWSDGREALALVSSIVALHSAIGLAGLLTVPLEPEAPPPEDTADGFSVTLERVSMPHARSAWVCAAVLAGIGLSLPGLLVQPVLTFVEAIGVAGLAALAAGASLLASWLPLSRWCAQPVCLRGRVLAAGGRSVVLHDPAAQIHRARRSLVISGSDDTIVLRGPEAQLDALAQRLLALSALPGTAGEVPHELHALGRRGRVSARE